MFLIRVLAIAFIIGYLIWFVNYKMLGKNLGLAKVVAVVLVFVSVMMVLLSVLSHLIEN